MNRYLLHNLSNNHNEVEVFHYVDNIFQSKKLLHTSNVYRIANQEKLATRLCQLANMDKAFFSNSGAEANEAAIKIARLYARSKNIHNRNSKLNLAILIDKSYLISITEKLRSTGSKIYIYPEHMLSFLKDESSIFKVSDRIIFSFSAGEGFRLHRLS